MDRSEGRNSSWSKTEATASRQRAWRISAKSEIGRVGRARAASARSRLRPSPLQREPSTTSRSAVPTRAAARAVPNGGSPGHQTVTGRSWTRSGATIAWRWRPVSPPAVTYTCSAQVSGPSARGTMQYAFTSARSHAGPSGSVGTRINVREGCLPVPIDSVAAASSPSSGLRATTTRLSTLVRAATGRSPSASPAPGAGGRLQMRPSSRSISATDVTCPAQRSVGPPGAAAIPNGTTPAALVVPASRPGPMLPARRPAPLRSGAIGARPVPATRRPRQGPSFPRRSWGSPAARRRPRRR